MSKTDFKRFGLMFDMSRNSVMNMSSLKKLIPALAEMGYNFIMLYTEDTYEIPEEPYFGHFRGRYTQAELKDFVGFCEGYGVEVIPCIQTLAHLNGLMRWSRFQRICDTGDILLAGEEETYELIDKMFKSVKECFKSDIIHVGLDEAHMLGLGKYLDKHGFENRFGIFSRHMHRVCEIAEKYELKPLMWSDMFFRLANHGHYYDVQEPVVPDPEKLGIPETMALTYWDYYTSDQERYQMMLHAHQSLNREIWYAGGIWTWKGFAPDNRFSIHANLAAVRACREEKVENVMFTLWGDNGGECLRSSVLPAMFATAAFARGEEDMEKIKADFEKKFGIPFDDFTLVDMHEHEHVENEYAKTAIQNPEKYLLYNDPFLGVCDSTLLGGESEYYADLGASLEEYAEHPHFGHLFRAQMYLAETLSHKAELGKKTRAAYQARDKGALNALLDEYDLSIEALDSFIAAYREAWLLENKPYGLEVHETRLGGLRQRLMSCYERLEQYLEDGIEIPELDEKPLDLLCRDTEPTKHIRYPVWGKALTANTIDVG